MSGLKKIATWFGLGAAGGAVAGVAGTAAGIAAVTAINKLASASSFNLSGDSHFPQDLENYKHYISFQFSEYKRRSIFDRAFYNGIGSIRLPMPANLVDQQKVDYETQGNLLVGAGVEYGLHPNQGSQAMAAAGALGGQIAGAAPIVSNAQTLINSPGGAQALQVYGLAVNPFLTVLFKSPTFKRHSFAWRLSPNDPKESTLINNILTKFRYHMLPAKADSAVGAILKYPDICNVKLHPDDNWLYKFKPCVVESISINFSPNGNPSFYSQTNAPSDVQFTINLLEIEYWLKEDFAGGPLGFGVGLYNGL
jgi:hypothetical protein